MSTGPWVHVSKDARDLLRQILEKDPNKRISATQILEHKWFKRFKTGDAIEENPDSVNLFQNIKSFNGRVKLHSVMMQFI